MGTLLRAGDQLRVVAQLVDVSNGTLLASQTVQSSMGDLFRLQDDIAQSVTEALALPLGAGTPSMPDSPHDALAYELYLRANELGRTYDGLPGARDLYTRCLELDSRFAPAWARLGRCHRVIGKYIDGAPESNARAEDAFRRALSISPRLSIAHKHYANLEAEIGNAEGAMVRLLGEATRHGNDPELFAGLVHACRYCGLYDQSIAAHAEARRLDPNVPTGVEQTLLQAGEVERMLAEKPPAIIAGADDGIRIVALGLAGRRDDAVTLLETMRHRSRIPTFVLWTDRLASWLVDRRIEMLGVSMIPGLKIRDDPEAIFQEGWMLCDVGDYEQGMFCLELAVSKGYLAALTLARSPQFDALRGNPRFSEVLSQAKAGRERALIAFRTSGGEALLGAVS
jgi:tetratricopeptide (TPR) repeat protein